MKKVFSHPSQGKRTARAIRVGKTMGEGSEYLKTATKRNPTTQSHQAPNLEGSQPRKPLSSQKPGGRYLESISEGMPVEGEASQFTIRKMGGFDMEGQQGQKCDLNNGDRGTWFFFLFISLKQKLTLSKKCSNEEKNLSEQTNVYSQKGERGRA